jgi:predicted naringenin-chalcone synthase
MTRWLGRLVDLRSATPTQIVPQEAVFDEFYSFLYRSIPNAEELFMSTQVRQRYMAWDPRVEFAGGFPPISARMRAWEEHTLAMGRESLAAVLAGVDTDRIGSFVMASCTGYAGPTPELLLAKEFSLRPDLRRTFIGHMGCYAAFNAIKVALDALHARPTELALVTCAEVCSVHVRPELTVEQVIVHALFGDAVVTILLSADPDAPGPSILGTHTETHYATSHAMTWHVQDDAFRMTLSPYVPVYLAESVKSFVRHLLEPHGLEISDVQHWAIHPGGPKIIEFVGERLKLDDRQLAPSLEVLDSYGNCSSTTVLLVLDRILAKHPPSGDHAVLMAFGPGLTMESVLVRL